VTRDRSATFIETTFNDRISYTNIAAQRTQIASPAAVRPFRYAHDTTTLHTATDATVRSMPGT
jgi:hypothetical protein